MDLHTKDSQRKSVSNQSKELANMFSTEKLMAHLDVSYSTARRYQRGHSVIRKPEREYLWLIYDKRIMPKSWPLNIIFNNEQLHLSKYSLNWGQLEHYSWMCERWGLALHNIETMGAYVDDVIESMTEVQRANARELQRIMIESVSTGQPYEIIKKA
jgi:hypothetical protein